MFSKNVKALSATIVFAALGFLHLQGASFPYTNDFSSAGFGNTDPGAGNSWSLENGSYRNRYASSTTGPSTASVQVTGVNVDFIMESQFTVSTAGSSNANGQTLGFGLFGSSTNFNVDGGNSYYLADFQFGNTSQNAASIGTLRILSLGNSAGYSGVNGLAVDDVHGVNLAVSVGTTYTLRLAGWYDENGALSMSFGLFDEFGLTQIGTSATGFDTSPLTGTYFGYRNRIGIGGGTTVMDFNDFAVVPAIPEPAHWAAFGAVSALLVLLLRRRLNS